jgi:sugar (glycoside-pentoside-hexuronide) transporter
LPPYTAAVPNPDRSEHGASDPPSPADAERGLSALAKTVFATGDHAINVGLSSLSLVYLLFLTDVAGLRPALAGAVVWIARIVDGVTDPAMGRISDHTRTRLGRRRPYFLLGALPYGLFFALLWTTPFSGQAPMFVYYAGIYMALSLAATVLSVPYMALIPEMARGYDERTSLNIYRTAGSLAGVVVAASLEPVAAAMGGDARAWALAGLGLGFWIVLPWWPVFAVSWERAIVHEPAPVSLWKDLRDLFAHDHYRRLSALYIASRIALDVAGAALVYFMTYAVGRREDFAPAILTLMASAAASLPLWMTLARSREKHNVFIVGTLWWVAWLAVIFFATPEWPRWTLFAITAAVGVGYAVADLMPWAMVGEVIDEDELRTGQRREGLYNGAFTFLRKLGGASAIGLAGLLLDVSGYVPRGEVQPGSALMAIRVLMGVVPSLFLLLAIGLAWRYPLDRARHDEILETIRGRET